MINELYVTNGFATFNLILKRKSEKQFFVSARSKLHKVRQTYTEMDILVLQCEDVFG